MIFPHKHLIPDLQMYPEIQKLSRNTKRHHVKVPEIVISILTHVISSSLASVCNSPCLIPLIFHPITIFASHCYPFPCTLLSTSQVTQRSKSNSLKWEISLWIKRLMAQTTPGLSHYIPLWVCVRGQKCLCPVSSVCLSLWTCRIPVAAYRREGSGFWVFVSCFFFFFPEGLKMDWCVLGQTWTKRVCLIQKRQHWEQIEQDSPFVKKKKVGLFKMLCSIFTLLLK